ncbi:MAG: hypothetical protein ACO31I_07160 [Prochlorotrichaceae cyanobacterium]|jgi:hypothetical protein
MSQILSLIIPDELYHQIENVELSGKRSLQETIIYLLKKAVDSEISPSKSINDRSDNYDFSDLVGRLEWQGDSVKVQRLLRDEW